jgi:hypothetical protein
MFVNYHTWKTYTAGVKGVNRLGADISCQRQKRQRANGHHLGRCKDENTCCPTRWELKTVRKLGEANARSSRGAHRTLRDEPSDLDQGVSCESHRRLLRRDEWARTAKRSVSKLKVAVQFKVCCELGRWQETKQRARAEGKWWAVKWRSKAQGNESRGDRSPQNEWIRKIKAATRKEC